VAIRHSEQQPRGPCLTGRGSRWKTPLALHPELDEAQHAIERGGEGSAVAGQTTVYSRKVMPDAKEPTQGHRIPVPKRRAWDRLRHRVAQPKRDGPDQAATGSEKRAMEDKFWGEEPAS
jgi:hypothetical protein